MAARCSSSTRILSRGPASGYLSSFSSSGCGCGCGCGVSQQWASSSRTRGTMYGTCTSWPSSQLSTDGRSLFPCNQQVVKKEGNHKNRGPSAVSNGMYFAEILKLSLLLKTSSSRLNYQKYATTNSMVQKGDVGGDTVKDVLRDLIHYNPKRKVAFQPRRSSRLSVMSKNEED